MLSAKLFLVCLLQLILISVSLCAIKNNIDNHDESDNSDSKKVIDCSNPLSVACLKLKLASWIEKLDENADIDVFPGVSVVKETVSDNSITDQTISDLAREFPNDPDARLDAYLTRKLAGYLNSHSLKFNFGKAAVEEARGKGGEGGGGGGGGKGGGGMGAILAAGAMMGTTLMAVTMKGIAAIAGKALMVGLMSLVISTIIGLKSLTHSGGSSTTYKIVAKPVHSHKHTESVSHEEHGGHYGSSGYARSFDTAPLPRGLRTGYKPIP